MAALAAIVSLGSAPAAVNSPSIALANDNARPAGRLVDGALTVSLVAREGVWQPEGANSPNLRLAAFAEEGQELAVPGPMIRVPEGTRITVRVINAFSDTLYVHGLVERPAASDLALMVPAGEARVVSFDAGRAGTYHYWATFSNASIATRPGYEGHLGGALIVDRPGEPSNDRVFVMGLWNGRTVPRGDDERLPPIDHTFTINGRSWPYTERLTALVGERVRWRVVNLTPAPHPMHLHGFYFDVVGEGTGLGHQTLAPEDYRHVVTHLMPPGSAMDIEWTPERAGNWLFHCHIVAHAGPLLRFWETPDAGHAHHGAAHAAKGMSGLVMGITVDGAAHVSAARPLATPAREITLAMIKRAGYWKPEDAFGFAINTGIADPTPADVTIPGPTLVLSRGEPVEITLDNTLSEATSIHWHGIELDSYYDGVAGFSGTSISTTPLIAPGESIVVRFTPPRAGTFIYHTHSHDDHQLASGLYGALIVLEPGETYDAARDHIVLLGSEGPRGPVAGQPFPVVVNGSRSAAVVLKRNTANRIRLINITPNFAGLNVSLMQGNQPLEWRPIAKDGANLSASRQIPRPALRQPTSVGETYDFVVHPSAAGPIWLEVRRGNGEWVQQVPVTLAP